MSVDSQGSAPEEPLRPMRFDGERRYALALEAREPLEEAEVEAFLAKARSSIERAEQAKAALAYAFVATRHADAIFRELGLTSLGPVPVLGRPLRLSAAAEHLTLPQAVRAVLPRAALLLPFRRGRRAGVREITTEDPRFSRLWDRFSIDVPVSVERVANYMNPRVFGRPAAGYRVFIFEDGDRYVIRALCIFRTTTEGGRITGQIAELLHDRSVSGMRAASHLLGLALREMSDAGAEMVRAWSLPHSGSFPLYALHAFLPIPSERAASRFGVRAFDADLEPIVTQRDRWYVSGLDFNSV